MPCRPCEQPAPASSAYSVLLMKGDVRHAADKNCPSQAWSEAHLGTALGGASSAGEPRPITCTNRLVVTRNAGRRPPERASSAVSLRASSVSMTPGRLTLDYTSTSFNTIPAASTCPTISSV